MPFFGVPRRNGVPIGLGSVAGFGISPFDPSQLFASGEQGAWYDPSDFSTMFQDSAGTTPVTAVEQPVGLILDKSKGLLETQLYETDFSNQLGWALTNATISGGVLNLSTSASASQTNSPPVLGGLYRVTYTISAINPGGGNVRCYVGSTGSGVARTTTGTFTEYIFASGATAIYFFTGGTFVSATIDNLTVTRIAGNHASQATTTSRPVLSARVNLLTYTEQFDNAAWAKTRSTITANAVTAPDGSLTADKLVEDTSASASHFISQQATYVNATTYVYSVYARAGERNWLCFNLPSALMTTSKVAYFDLTNGVTGTVDSGLTASISAVGNNWYRCSISFTATASVTASILLVLATANGTLNYTGDGTSGIYIWGADLRVTNDGVGLPVYQRVAASTDYDTSGFPYYLRFDGTDDSLATASIDFSAGDKMSVFAGLRRMSDALSGVMYELSASATANNGTFYFFTPSTNATPTIQIGSRGTATATSTYNNALITAPITILGTTLMDIFGDRATLRVNASQVAQSIADQGTGNYGNYPLFIGRRNNASLPLNARLYSFIVRGAASTDDQIASTEAWVNGKTGAY